MTRAIISASDAVKAPLIYKGKVRELYDLGEHLLIVATDRISAHDYVLEPPVPHKGILLNQMSLKWFRLTEHIIPNHILHANMDFLSDVITNTEVLRGRAAVVRKAARIPVECVVRGYLTGGGWREYEATGKVNEQEFPSGLRKNEQLPSPIFTPAQKNDIGHDVNISFAELTDRLGSKLANHLMEMSFALFRFASDYCDQRGIFIADSKFEFGLIGEEIILIDELFTPDSTRYWSKDKFTLDSEIESLDKEPIRHYITQLQWDGKSPLSPLPLSLVEETTARYQEIMKRLFPLS